MASEIISLINPAFRAYLFYSTICLMKMFMLAFKTTFLRLTKHVYSNPEDVKSFSNDQDKKANIGDEDVERARRNHLNDLENIPLFIFLSFFLLFTGCSAYSAIWHFRIFTVSRILHSISYQLGLQPYRSIAFIVGVLVNMSMMVQIILATV